MGIAIPPSVETYPVRVHGHKHWLSWTLDERPSEYHIVVRYQDAEGTYIGSASVMYNPGTIRRVLGLSAEDADNKFADIVEKYEEGKTADEVVVWMEPNGIDLFLERAWRSHQVVELP